MRIVIAALAAFISLMPMPLEAQASEHQRIGVERQADWELGFELGSGMTAEAYYVIDYASLGETLIADGLTIGDAFFE